MEESMAYKRILTVQDISCLGQCSVTTALPILSACGHETCVIPSAILSTHTGGSFSGYTFRDLTEDIPLILDHWRREGVAFDALYTGYLGNVRQAEIIQEIIRDLLRPGGLVVVDPAMADNGVLYAGLDKTLVTAMAGLCAGAEVALPNITEACLLTGLEYREHVDDTYIKALAGALLDMGAKKVVLTGVSFQPEYTGVAVFDGRESRYYRHRRIPRMFHGTGDVYAAAFTGALLSGLELFRAARLAADFTVKSIENSLDDPAHWYGVKFEPVIPFLIQRLQEERPA